MVCNTITNDQSRQCVGDSNMIEINLRFPILHFTEGSVIYCYVSWALSGQCSDRGGKSRLVSNPRN